MNGFLLKLFVMLYFPILLRLLCVLCQILLSRTSVLLYHFILCYLCVLLMYIQLVIPDIDLSYNHYNHSHDFFLYFVDFYYL